MAFQSCFDRLEMLGERMAEMGQGGLAVTGIIELLGDREVALHLQQRYGITMLGGKVGQRAAFATLAAFSAFIAHCLSAALPADRKSTSLKYSQHCASRI